MRLRKLIRLYQTEPLSRWHGLRHGVKVNQRNLLRQISRRHGRTKLKSIKARTILAWHAEWLDGGHYAAAHAFVKKLRAVFGFGVTILEDKECSRLRVAMSAMRFPAARKGTKRVTAPQAIAIRRQAHACGDHVIALAQALQFELMLRQKDVIGEWIPEGTEDITPYIVDGETTWARGLLWEEIDHDLVLRHRTSKRGKLAVFDLKLAPMVMEELARFTTIPRSGPVVISPTTSLPYAAHDFRRRWRQIARAAGVPDDVFNMHSRAGGITEAFDAKANPDFIRASATHSDLATTQGYNRGEELERTSSVLRARSANRAADHHSDRLAA